jgi:hypothetical protein
MARRIGPATAVAVCCQSRTLHARARSIIAIVTAAEAEAALLSVAPEVFVETRERLARDLTADGQRSEAAELRKLRKPTALAAARPLRKKKTKRRRT